MFCVRSTYIFQTFVSFSVLNKRLQEDNELSISRNFDSLALIFDCSVTLIHPGLRLTRIYVYYTHGRKKRYRRAEHSLLLWMYLYIFDILFLSPYMFCVIIFMALVGCWSSAFIRRIMYKFLNVCLIRQGLLLFPLMYVLF